MPDILAEYMDARFKNSETLLGIETIILLKRRLVLSSRFKNSETLLGIET